MGGGPWAASGRWLSDYAGSSRPEALGQSSPPLSPPDDDDEHLHCTAAKASPEPHIGLSEEQKAGFYEGKGKS